jgi:hypothetical protein
LAQPAKRENYDTAYPPDFKTVKSHILVIIYDKESEVPSYESKHVLKGFNKDFKEVFPKNYTGDYDFITMSKDIEDNTDYDNTDKKFRFKIINSSYADVSKYRYILFSKCYLSMIGMTTITNFQFGIYDRKTEKSYTTSWHSGSNKPLMEYYLKRLEEVSPK